MPDPRSGWRHWFSLPDEGQRRPRGKNAGLLSPAGPGEKADGNGCPRATDVRIYARADPAGLPGQNKCLASLRLNPPSMHIALFILYSALCGYGILKLPFFRRTGIRPGILLAFFAIHVGAGCLHNLIAWRYYPDHGDIWDSFREGIQLRNWLQTDFQQFLASNSRWTDFTHNGVKFIHLILNLLSMDNLYINTLLFAFPVFLGNTALSFVFRRHFQAPLTPLVVFLLPSTLFWTACVFREGVLYMLLGFFFYQLDRVFSSPAPAAVSHNRQAAAARTPAAIAAFCCFLLILYFRFTVGIVLAPALLVMR